MEYRIPLAKLSPVYREDEAHRGSGVLGRIILWVLGLGVAAGLYFGLPAFWNWKHPLSSSGGRFFVHRVEIPVPAFQQGDPRWDFELLGSTYETLGQSGCAITSAAMVLSAYGVDTDPERLNQLLITNNGYTTDGKVYWEKAAEAAPYHQVEKVYEDDPSYALIDQNLLAGNPVIIRLTLPSGRTHFVVIVGKEGWDYLIRDPARVPTYGVYPLKNLTSTIQALRYYRVVPPTYPPPLPPPAAIPASSAPPTAPPVITVAP